MFDVFSMGERRVAPWWGWIILIFAFAFALHGIAYTLQSSSAFAYSYPIVAIAFPDSQSKVAPVGFCIQGTAFSGFGISEVRVYAYDYGRSTYTVLNAKAEGTTSWQYFMEGNKLTPGSAVYVWVRARDNSGYWSSWTGRYVQVAASRGVNDPRAGLGVSCAGNSPAEFSLQPTTESSSQSVVQDTSAIAPPTQDIPTSDSADGEIKVPTEGAQESLPAILSAPTDSGWVYLAKTKPDERGFTYWLSITKRKNDVGILYGITDTVRKTHYSGFLYGGALSTSTVFDHYMISYTQNGKTIAKAEQAGIDGDMRLDIDLPWPSAPDGSGRLQASKEYNLERYLYESGDGVIPMSNNLLSWYISFTFQDGLWMDIQKFNLADLDPGTNVKSANHRWGSFMLHDHGGGGLPQGSVGVWWEILDPGNNRQPGGFTNIDVVTSQYRKTRDTFEIIPIQTYNSGSKTYLKKWRLVQKELGIDLLMETIVPNQEHRMLGQYFYEGAVKIYDPNVLDMFGEGPLFLGTGMLEQTHNEVQ